jgi:hypothetical protein
MVRLGFWKENDRWRRRQPAAKMVSFSVHKVAAA